MEIHAIPWPQGARFTRIALVEDGIPRDAIVRLVPPELPGGTAVLHVWHRTPGDWVPLAFEVQTSSDGTNWIVVNGPPQTRAA